jgi:hypothetical protein
MTAAMEFEDVAAAVVRWHVGRFPMATAEHVGLKAAAEVGELCDAVLGDVGQGGDGAVACESADVFIVLCALLGRWYPEVDLLAEVRAKLAILTDPDSGHRSAVLR